jgi:C-terminal processing protease CtpA/Prc
MNGDEFQMTVMLKVGDEATGAEKLSGLGLETRDDDGKVIVDIVGFGSPAEKAKIDFDQEILSIQMPTERPNKELMFIPAMLLLVFVYRLQKGRAATA